jgi:L,D-peptidoglycan transpeptidase YkuD (ErfK/YbiS/YcfS/YnhG family)
MTLKIFLSAAAVCAMAAFAFGQVKKPEPTAKQVPFEKSRQAIVVTATDWTTIHGSARLYERRNGRADWKPVGEAFPVVVGRNGLGLAAGI